MRKNDGQRTFCVDKTHKLNIDIDWRNHNADTKQVEKTINHGKFLMKIKEVGGVGGNWVRRVTVKFKGVLIYGFCHRINVCSSYENMYWDEVLNIGTSILP